MEDSIKVSIIVAIYNSAKFLDKLILSIMNQTYKNIEIILVDDGSPDNSGEICDKYQKMDDRIIVIHKKNGGTCDARNVGLKRVSGDYITIIDGDDWLSKDYIEYLLNLAVSTDSEMAMSLNIFTTRDQQQIEKDQIEVLTPEEAVLTIIYPRMPIGPWNKIYKTSLVFGNHVTFDVPWSGEGLYFTSKLAALSNHVAMGRRKVYNYRLNNTGSGLTHYKVAIADNALWNIKNIGKTLPLMTPRIKEAVNWHIWKNYNFLLRLILATHSVRKNFGKFVKCLVMIRLKAPRAILKSELSRGEKKNMLYRSLFPIRYAKKLTKQQVEELAKDKMK